MGHRKQLECLLVTSFIYHFALLGSRIKCESLTQHDARLPINLKLCRINFLTK
jgi:hypothetical protein